MMIFRKVRRSFKRTRLNVVVFAILILSAVSLLKPNFVTELLSYQTVDISCHYGVKKYFVPLLRENDTVPSKSIFFIEPSCVNNLTLRQSCAIESAANSHPNWQINVIFSGMSYEPDKLKPFKKLRNIKFWRINIKEFSKSTPLEELEASGILKKCRWGVERTLDILKYLILRKWGGIYIDLDMIVARPLGSLARNWVTRENDQTIAEEIFGFSNDRVGRIVSESAIRYIQSKFKSVDWCNSPQIMNEVLQDICSTTDARFMSSATCNGFEVYGQQFFYPLLKTHAADYFTSGDLEIDNAYTYYLGGRNTKKYKVMKASPYTKLARRYCPKSYQLYGNRM